MLKKFEINRTKIKGSCQSGRKVITHDSKSDLPLEFEIFFFFSYNKSHQSLLDRVPIWSLWKPLPFRRSVIHLPKTKTSLTLKKMTTMTIGKGNINVFSNHQRALRSIFKYLIKWQQDLKISSNDNKIFKNLVKWQQDF